jgi:hypothetical protein
MGDDFFTGGLMICGFALGDNALMGGNMGVSDML